MSNDRPFQLWVHRRREGRNVIGRDAHVRDGDRSRGTVIEPFPYGPYYGTTPVFTADEVVAPTGRRHRVGVPIETGTDGNGLDLVRELELRETAGQTGTEASQNATIVPARMTGMADRVGFIAAGMTADAILVDGDASLDLRVLRHVRTVFLDGYRLDGDALRRASGFGAMSI